MLGITARQPWDGALDERAVRAREQRLGGAVGHGERARIDVRRWIEEVGERELVHARMLAVRLLVRRRDESMLDGKARRFPPERRHFDVVDAPPPSIPLRERGLVRAVGELEPVEAPTGKRPQRIERWFDRTEDVGRKRPQEVGPKHPIGRVLISELGRWLEERHRASSLLRAAPGLALDPTHG